MTEPEITQAQSFQRAAQIGADVGPVTNAGLITTMADNGVAVWFFKDGSIAVTWDKGVRAEEAVVIAYAPQPLPEEG